MCLKSYGPMEISKVHTTCENNGDKVPVPQNYEENLAWG